MKNGVHCYFWALRDPGYHWSIPSEPVFVKESKSVGDLKQLMIGDSESIQLLGKHAKAMGSAIINVFWTRFAANAVGKTPRRRAATLNVLLPKSETT